MAVAVPVWLFIGVTGWGRTANLSKEDVLGLIDAFLAGTAADPWEFDDFITIPLSDPDLEAVRKIFAAAPETWPPTSPYEYCSAEGLVELRKIADDLRKMPANPPLQPTSGGDDAAG